MSSARFCDHETWDAAARSAAVRPGDAPEPVVEITPALRSWTALLGALWARRELVGYLAWRDIRARYCQTTLGVLWAILQPLAATLVFAVVFGKLVKIQSGDVPYPVFVMTGILTWQLVSSSIQRSATSLIANGDLIRKVSIPRLAIPLASVATSLIEFGAACLVLFGLMHWYGVRLPLHAGLLPLVLLLASAMGLGVGLMLASISTRFRDVTQGLSFGLQMWMYLTPIFYPLSLVPDRFQFVIWCNPMTGLVGAARSVLLGTPVDARAVAMSVAWAALFLVLGGAAFRRVDRVVADVL